MTHPIYTRDLLENFSRSELHEVCDRLSIKSRRSREDCIADILAAQPQPVAHKAIEKPQDPNFEANYEKAVAQAELEVEQPANLPQVNDTHFIGGFLLRCAQVNGESDHGEDSPWRISREYAVVWDVLDEKNSVMGEIRMGWDCFWSHNMSLNTFATPQEAVVDLRESLEAFVIEDEAIAFEKVADSASGSDAGASGRWEAMVNGVLVRITLEEDQYKCSLADTVFADYDLAVIGSLLAVARVQEQRGLGVSPTEATAEERLLERTERANTIEVLEQNGNEFVVKNLENGNHYIVCPSNPEVNQRCECADCHYRGAKCKHHIAVEKFLFSLLQK